MHNIRIRRVYSPIKCVQATLLKFDSSLPEPSIPTLRRVIEKSTEIKEDSRYHIENVGYDEVQIVETHCIDCGARLLKNGINNRLVILDKGLGKFRLKLHRKRCPNCGEIKPDYSPLAPKYGNYHENFRRISRQLYSNDSKFRQIGENIKIFLNIKVSISSIFHWLKEVKEPLRTMLSTTPVPNSGYWGGDEIFLHVGGKKMYQLDLVDLGTKFIPNAMIMQNMGKSEWRSVLTAGKFGKRGLIIKGLVKDGTTGFGNLIQKHGFTHMIIQTCKTHLKWAISKHIKAYAGLPLQSQKPLPKEYQKLLRRFYDVIDAGNVTEFEINLLIVGDIVNHIHDNKKKHLSSAIRLLHAKKDEILAYSTNPFMDTTNNLNESYHKKYIRYSPFKKQMKTEWGIQFRSDITRFRHNFERFKAYIDEFWQKIDKFKLLMRENKTDRTLSGSWIHLLSEKKELEFGFGEYLELWEDYFCKI